MATRRRRKASEDATSVPKMDKVTITASRAYVTGGTTVSEDSGVEELEVRKFEVEPAYISVNHGRTANLGNYESARVDVRVSVPCYAEEIEEAIAYADVTASDNLEVILKEYIEELK